jgi:hypothetical protein
MARYVRPAHRTRSSSLSSLRRSSARRPKPPNPGPAGSSTREPHLPSGLLAHILLSAFEDEDDAWTPKGSPQGPGRKGRRH